MPNDASYRRAALVADGGLGVTADLDVFPGLQGIAVWHPQVGGGGDGSFIGRFPYDFARAVAVGMLGALPAAESRIRAMAVAGAFGVFEGAYPRGRPVGWRRRAGTVDDPVLQIGALFPATAPSLGIMPGG